MSTSIFVQRDLHYGPDPIEVADVYRPSGTTGRLPGVLIVHGGGWHSGSKGGWSTRARELAGAGFVVVVANYQLASATVTGFPHQLHELKQAVTWMRSDAAKLHIGRPQDRWDGIVGRRQSGGDACHRRRRAAGFR